MTGTGRAAADDREVTRCSVCGRSLDALTADANLLGDWPHCDACLDAQLAPLRLAEAWEWHIRAYVRRQWRRERREGSR